MNINIEEYFRKKDEEQLKLCDPAAVRMERMSLSRPSEVRIPAPGRDTPTVSINPNEAQMIVERIGGKASCSVHNGIMYIYADPEGGNLISKTKGPNYLMSIGGIGDELRRLYGNGRAIPCYFVEEAEGIFKVVIPHEFALEPGSMLGGDDDDAA